LHVGATNGQLGLVLLAIGAAALPAMLVTGRFADRAGPRLVVWTLGAFAVVGLFPPLARGPVGLFVLLLALGAASGALDVSINARASALERAGGGRIMDALHAAFSAGVVVGGVGGGLLRREGAGPFNILAGVAVVVILAAVANLRAGPVPPLTARYAALARPLLVVGAVLALALLIEGGVENWSALFLENRLGASPAISGLGPGLFAAAMLAGRLLAQRGAPDSSALRMAFAGAAAAAGLIVVVVAHARFVALAGFVCAGFGLALSAPTLLREAGRLGAGPAVSTATVLGYLGFVGGPPLIGAVNGASSLRGGFVFLAVVAAILVTTAPILRRFEHESDR
jgi:MFS family permease